MWLGRSVEGVPVPLVPALEQVEGEWVAAITRNAVRYGFHGTWKPPFRLAPGSVVENLLEAAASFAADHRPFPLPPLEIREIGSFLALVPAQSCDAVDTLAAECVRDFEPFRAAPGEDELSRRRAGGLTDRQESLLVRWGYPYVFEEFRFHLPFRMKSA